MGKTDRADTPTRARENKTKNKAKFLKALAETGGNVTRASELSGIGRSTHYEYMADDQEYAEKVNQVYDVLVDEAEQTIVDLMRSSNDKVKLDASKEILKARGKSRGYGVEKRESKLSGALDVKATVQDVRFELPNNDTSEGGQSPLPPGWETATGGGE